MTSTYVYGQVTKPSAGRSSYDWSKGGRRLALLSDQVEVDRWVNTASEAAVCFSFPMTVNVVLIILLKHEHDRLLSLTTWLLLLPRRQRSPNMNKVVILMQTTMFPQS